MITTSRNTRELESAIRRMRRANVVLVPCNGVLVGVGVTGAVDDDALG